MTKCCLKKEVWNGVQFNYIDGIDGQETRKHAKSLGLSQNEGHSLLWEIQSISGWKIVNHGDWILSADRGIHGEKIYTVVNRDEFEKTMYTFEDK